MDEIDMRANFYRKLDEGMQLNKDKTQKEYIEQAAKEIADRDKAMRDFVESLVPYDGKSET